MVMYKYDKMKELFRVYSFRIYIKVYISDVCTVYISIYNYILFLTNLISSYLVMLYTRAKINPFQSFRDEIVYKTNL